MRRSRASGSRSLPILPAAHQVNALNLAAAHKNVSSEEDTESMEAVFVQALEAAGSSEEYRVDDGCKAFEVEP